MNETERLQMKKELKVLEAVWDDAATACRAAMRALPARCHAAIKAAEATEAATIKAACDAQNAVFRSDAGEDANDAAHATYAAVYKAAKAAAEAAKSAAIDKCPGGAAYKALYAVSHKAMLAFYDAESKFNASDDRPQVRLYDASNPRNEVGTFRFG